MPLTIASSLEDLNNTPYEYEFNKRLHLLKYFLYEVLGPQHMLAVNHMNNEILLTSQVPDRGMGSAIALVLSPKYSTKVILHDYPVITQRLIMYLLNGIGEEVLRPIDVEAGESKALDLMRSKLTREFYRNHTT